jgi:hypothetical protein
MKYSRTILVGCYYVAAAAIVLRHDYFMDVFVGIVTAHLVYRLTYKYEVEIGQFFRKVFKI